MANAELEDAAKAHSDYVIWRIMHLFTPMNDTLWLEGFTLLTDAWSAYSHAANKCQSYAQREGLEELAEWFKRNALKSWKHGAEAAMQRKPK